MSIHLPKQPGNGVVLPLSETMVEPEHVYRAVIAEQFFHLVFVVGVVARVISLEVVGVGPIPGAVIPSEPEFVFSVRPPGPCAPDLSHTGCQQC